MGQVMLSVQTQIISRLSTAGRARDLVPQAILSTPLDYVATQLGLPIEADEDDLDIFEGLSLVLNHLHPMAIRHYRGHPKDTVTVYLPPDIGGLEHVSGIIAELVTALDLDREAIFWERIKDPLL